MRFFVCFLLWATLQTSTLAASPQHWRCKSTDESLHLHGIAAGALPGAVFSNTIEKHIVPGAHVLCNINAVKTLSTSSMTRSRYHAFYVMSSAQLSYLLISPFIGYAWSLFITLFIVLIILNVHIYAKTVHTSLDNSPSVLYSHMCVWSGVVSEAYGSSTRANQQEVHHGERLA